MLEKRTAPRVLPKRLRRLRRNGCIRTLVRETTLSVSDLTAPLFVIDGQGPAQAIASMPGIERRPIKDLVSYCETLARLGIPAVALFPCLEAERKDGDGTEALKGTTLVLRAIRAVKNAVPELIIFSDIALDPYTDHGHDGLLTKDGTDVDNDRTVSVLARMAVLHAEAGADWVAPSDMMDGRVARIREALETAGFPQIGILAYAAKFASGFYGPFREAVGSATSQQFYLDKRTYQLEAGNRRQALREALLDVEEGTDAVMVKPAGSYLDIIREVRDAEPLLPLAAYQVSGEYAQLHAAAEQGWIDLERCRGETLLSIKRAGADIIFTYFAEAAARALLK